jgi:hypothetical protein
LAEKIGSVESKSPGPVNISLSFMLLTNIDDDGGNLVDINYGQEKENP